MSPHLFLRASPSLPRLRAFPSTQWLARFFRVLGIVCVCVSVFYIATVVGRVPYSKYLAYKKDSLQSKIDFDNDQRKGADVQNQINAILRRPLISQKARNALLAVPTMRDEQPQQTPSSSPVPTATAIPPTPSTDSTPLPPSTPPPFSAQRQQWEAELAELNEKTATLFQLDQRFGDWTGIGQLSLLLVYIVPIVIISLFILGRRLNIVNVKRILKNDLRLPILYLRSFEHDNLKHRVNMKQTDDTEEELFVRALNKIGPVIAIGRPKEVIPPVGAARFYAANDEWQRAVELIVPHCKAVILRIGRTKGLHWEIGHLRQSYSPQQLALYCPPAKGEAEFSSFRQSVQQTFEIDLPTELQSAGYVIFDNAWRAFLFAGDSEGLARKLARVSLPQDAQPKWRDTAEKLGLLA